MKKGRGVRGLTFLSVTFLSVTFSACYFPAPACYFSACYFPVCDFPAWYFPCSCWGYLHCCLCSCEKAHKVHNQMPGPAQSLFVDQSKFFIHNSSYLPMMLLLQQQYFWFSNGRSRLRYYYSASLGIHEACESRRMLTGLFRTYRDNNALLGLPLTSPPLVVVEGIRLNVYASKTQLFETSGFWRDWQRLMLRHVEYELFKRVSNHIPY